MSESDIISSILWAAGVDTCSGSSIPCKGVAAPAVNANPARVINLSLRSFNDLTIDRTYDSVLQTVITKGSVIVAAAGNDGENGTIDSSSGTPKAVYPAAGAGVISVGASAVAGGATNFTNWGPLVDIMAPGEKIVVNTLQPNKFVDGTSFAAPIISAIVAEMNHVYPNIPAAVAKHILRRTARLWNCDKTCPAIYSAAQQAQCKQDMCSPDYPADLNRPLGLVDAGAALAMAQRGLPREPIINISRNYFRLGQGWGRNNSLPSALLSNYGNAPAKIVMRPPSDRSLQANVGPKNPNIMLYAANGTTPKRTGLYFTYSKTPGIKKNIIVYFDVYNADTDEYIDTFAAIVLINT